MKFIKIIIILLLFYKNFEKTELKNFYWEIESNKLFEEIPLFIYVGINKEKLGKKIPFKLILNMKDNYMVIPKNLFSCNNDYKCNEEGEYEIKTFGDSKINVKKIETFSTFYKDQKIEKDMPIMKKNMYISDDNEKNYYGIITLSYLNNLSNLLFKLEDNYIWGLDEIVSNLDRKEKYNIDYKAFIFNYHQSKSIKYLSNKFKYELNWKDIFDEKKIDVRFSNKIKNTIFTFQGTKETIKNITSKFYEDNKEKKKKELKKNFEHYIQIVIDDKKDTIEYNDKNLLNREKEVFKFDYDEKKIVLQNTIFLNEGFFQDKMKIISIDNKKNNFKIGFDEKKYFYKKRVHFIIFISCLILWGIILSVVLLFLKKNRNKMMEQHDYEKIDEL